MEPTREDIRMVGGARKEFRWQLTRSGSPLALGEDDLVELYISEGPGKPYRARIVTDVEDGDEGIVKATVDGTYVPVTRTTKTWWYEVWLSSLDDPANRHSHIVGELAVMSTIVTAV